MTPFRKSSNSTVSIKKEIKLHMNSFRTIWTFLREKDSWTFLLKFFPKWRQWWLRLFMQWLKWMSNINWILTIGNIHLNFMDMTSWLMKTLCPGSLKSTPILVFKPAVRSFNRLSLQCYKIWWKFVLILLFLHRSFKIGHLMNYWPAQRVFLNKTCSS